MGQEGHSKTGGKSQVLRMRVGEGELGRPLFLEPLLVSSLLRSLQKPGFQVRLMRSGDI